MLTNINYVKWIQGGDVTIFCEGLADIALLKNIGAKRKVFKRNIWVIKCDTEIDLARKLQTLNNSDFKFAGGSSGWNPVDIYILMRNKKLVTGDVSEIVWGRAGEVLTRIL